MHSNGQRAPHAPPCAPPNRSTDFIPSPFFFLNAPVNSPLSQRGTSMGSRDFIYLFFLSSALMEGFHPVPPVLALALCVCVCSVAVTLQVSVSCHGLQVAPLVPRGGSERAVATASIPVAHQCPPLWNAAWSCGGPGAPSCPLLKSIPSHPVPCPPLQIETLMMEMQNPDTGVKTQAQTVMIANIPHAVTGKSFPEGRTGPSSAGKSCVWTPGLPVPGCMLELCSQ